MTCHYYHDPFVAAASFTAAIRVRDL